MLLFLYLDNNGLTSHGVLVIVLMVLVKDGGNLFTILPDGQQSLLVVVGGNVEHEQIGATAGSSEDTSVSIKSTSNIAVGAVEGEILLSTTIIGLASVGIEVDTTRFVGQSTQVGILLLHPGAQIINLTDSVLVVRIHPGLKLVVGRFSVRDLLADPVVDGLVLRVSGVLLRLKPLVQGGNVSLAAIVLSVGKFVQSGDFGLSGIVLAVGKVVQVSDFSLSCVIVRLGSVVKSLDLRLSGIVL